jgi:hypothetical protein
MMTQDRLALLLRNGQSYQAITETLRAERVQTKTRCQWNRGDVYRFWQEHKGTTPCPSCGGIDWDITTTGKILCIRCSEQEE